MQSFSFQKIGLKALVMMLFPTILPLMAHAQAPPGSSVVTCALVGAQQPEAVLTRLNSLGYRYQARPNLRLNLFNIRPFLQREAFVIDRVDQDTLKVYFQIQDQAMQQILYFQYNLAHFPECRILKHHISLNQQRRAVVRESIQFAKNALPATGFLRQILNLEKIKHDQDGRKTDTNAESEIASLFEAARFNAIENASLPFFTRLREVRKVILNRYLKNYCRDTSTLLRSENVNSCTNCVGQTTLLLAMYNDLNLQPPEGWQYGFSVYRDHMQAVLYNRSRAVQIDLFTNRVEPVGKENILPAKELFRLSLQQPYLRNLVFKLDRYDLSDTQYLYRKTIDPLNSVLRNLRTGARSLVRLRSVQSSDLYVYDNLNTYSNFSNQVPPDTAQLSDEEINADYSQNPVSSESVGEGDANAESAGAANGESGRIGNAESGSAANGGSGNAANGGSGGVTNGRAEQQYSESQLEAIRQMFEDFQQELLSFPNDLHPNERLALEMDAKELTSMRPIQQWMYFSLCERFNTQNSERGTACGAQSPMNSRMLSPFAIEVDTQLNEQKFYFRHESTGRTLFVGSERDRQFFRSLKLVDRYLEIYRRLQRVLTLEMIPQARELTSYFNSPRPLEVFLRDSNRWTQFSVIHNQVVKQLESVQSLNDWLPPQISQDLFTRILIPELQAQLTARVNFANRTKEQKLNLMRSLNALSPTDLRKWFGFIAEVSDQPYQVLASSLDPKLKGSEWLTPLSGLMLGLMYDERYLHTSQLTEQERARLLISQVERLPARPDNHLPEINLPQVDFGADCTTGESRDLGGIVVHCPQERQQITQSDQQSQPSQSRPQLAIGNLPAIEHQPRVIANLIIANGSLFFHPGHLLLLTRIWTPSLENEFEKEELEIRRTGSAGYRGQLDHFKEWSSLWRTAIRVILSKDIPQFSNSNIPYRCETDAALADCRFHKDIRPASTSGEVPYWILSRENSLYRRAFDNYRQGQVYLGSPQDRFVKPIFQGQVTFRQLAPSISQIEQVSIRNAHFVFSNWGLSGPHFAEDSDSSRARRISLLATIGHSFLRLNLIFSERGLIVDNETEEDDSLRVHLADLFHKNGSLGYQPISRDGLGFDF